MAVVGVITNIHPTAFEDFMKGYIDQHAENVASASAAYLWNVLPSIAACDPSEGFKRLMLHIQTAILAYFAEVEGVVIPEPSVN